MTQSHGNHNCTTKGAKWKGVSLKTTFNIRLSYSEERVVRQIIALY